MTGEAQNLSSFIFFHKLPQLLFVMTQLLLAVPARERCIGRFGKPFRRSMQPDFPADKEDQGHTKKTPGEWMRNKQKRREHHKKVPVINPAIRTTSIFHHPHLEWTEKQNTDHIADTVGQADQDQNALIDQFCKVQGTDNTVQNHPGNDYGNRPPPGQKFGLFSARGFIITLKLLLAPHAFQPGRKKTACHLHGVNHSDQSEKPVSPLKSAEQLSRIPHAADNVHHQCCGKQSKPIDQFHIMQQGDRRQFTFYHVRSYRPYLPAQPKSSHEPRF